MSDAGPNGGYQKMPPGWDCKYDQATGNCYYINYLTKAMQLEDPRGGRNYKQLQNERCSTESIALQHIAPNSHHSSPYHVVHPSNNLTAVRAFQDRERHQPALHNLSTSPLLSASSRGQLEMSSPLPFQRARLASNMSRRSTIQETSFSHPSETQAVVTKIQNMFPTADENHIRLLLKRYYNREAVVISALQVEKHPVTMPGPFVTPPAQRHLFHSNSAFYMTPPARRLDMGASRVTVTSRTASPLPGGRIGSLMSMHSATPPLTAAHAVHGVGVVGLHGSPQWRSSPKPHSSPKMKLRYMKNIFPKADEMLLLDILANADNNVQFASEKLISLGYTKRDMQLPHRPNNRPPQMGTDQQAGNDQAVRHIPLRPKEYTAEEKTDMEALLKERYPQVAERIILMALESVNYAEDRATQILQIVQDEDEQRNQKQAVANGLALDSIQTVVTDQMDAPAPLSKPHKLHRHFPSINVTTPTTATTQIILSNTPTQETDNDYGNEKVTVAAAVPEASQKTTLVTSPISSASTHSYASPVTQSPYERLTTKSILARSLNNNNNYNNNNNSYGISGYLHGSHSSASSYSSYSTSMTSSSLASASASSITKAIESRARIKPDSLKQRQHSSLLDTAHNLESSEFQSLIERMATLGPNSQLTKGADENLLLADYVTWNGPNTTLTQKHIPHGADASLLNGERSYKPSGRNAELCKGAKKDLTKGSIYAQGKGANIKCN
ncbi:uncharacterized protein LOC6570559 isoform X1 [Drosophila grimshawi]|uniref:uncharacterized protein LOC6570559 isoform X1 n=1 Tax=Drosophila grimshawi TaxID=7222 RepID=UPI001C933EF1|nr:uncharacterized protein LOC6570559 isoform X1 [Drosophila grimshawi]